MQMGGVVLKMKKQQELLMKCKAKIQSLTEEKGLILANSNRLQEGAAEVAEKLAVAQQKTEELRGNEQAHQQLQGTVQ